MPISRFAPGALRLAPGVLALLLAVVATAGCGNLGQLSSARRDQPLNPVVEASPAPACPPRSTCR
jgi:hypothetical protein